MRRLIPYFALILQAAGVGVYAQQTTAVPLKLSEAVAVSLDKSPERHIAAAGVSEARMGARLARTALLPQLSFGEEVVRGNDPVFVFGTLLRQDRFTQSNFALNSLNRPTPTNNVATRLSGRWLAFDGWRTELEIKRADQLARSAQASADRTAQEIVFQVVSAYEGVLLAQDQLGTAQHQVETAEALLAAAKTRVDAGTAVDADQLSAAANLARRQQELIAAQGDVGVAWAELERAMGAPVPEERRSAQPAAVRRYEQPALAEAVAMALRSRADRASLDHRAAAEATQVRAAKSAFSPTINTFGSWEADRDSFADAGGNNWQAGAELRVDILPFARREELALAKVAQQRAAAAIDAADQQIRLQVTRSWYAHQSASKMLDVAQAAVDQSEASLRILKDRYDAGLTTMTEVLRAEDVQRQARADYQSAITRNAVTWAELKSAMGTLRPDQLSDFE